MNLFKTKLLLILTFVFSNFTLLFADSGTIRGSINDKGTGEPLMFANVLVRETGGGAQTDFDGNFEINVPPGTYTLEISYLGYAQTIVKEVEVKADQVTVLDFLLQEESEQLSEVVIAANRINRTENALLALQRRSISIQDGISAEGIAKYASSNAADAVLRIPGASVVDGKYVVVRGLGDRYSNALLNGQQLPSTDPYRNSTQLDLIPANMLENIIASKTFTPDQPGNFTGGSVNIKTKNFPEEFTLLASVTTSYNTQSTFQNNFLTHGGGKRDWLGYDDGNRALSDFNRDPATLEALSPSSYIRARNNEELANLIERSSDGFNTNFSPITDRSPLNTSVSFSVGNQFKLFKNPLGFLFGANFKRNFSFYENGDFNYWELSGAHATQLSPYYQLQDTRGVENPNLGGLFNLAYKFGKGNEISFNALYNHDAEKTTRYLAGDYPGILSSGQFESRVLGFKERELKSYQVSGTHQITPQGLKFEWGGSLVEVSQLEPDLRQVANSFKITLGEIDTTFAFNRAEFDLPFHYFRDLSDKQWLAKADLTIPFGQKFSKANKFMVGFMHSSKDRVFDESTWQLNDRSNVGISYDGNLNQFFSDDNIGFIGIDNNNRFLVGNFWQDAQITSRKNSYTGNESVTALYGMGIFQWKMLKIIAGARGERTDISVQSRDTTEEKGKIDKYDILPSVNLIYALNDKTNLRASITQTLARPNMRELAPFSAADFNGGIRITGNPNLKRTLTTNYDLRWEFFPKIGELIAIGGYYKSFSNPIVKSYLEQAANPEIQFQNVGRARVYGLELELRKHLDFLSPALANFSLTTNFSLIKSTVDIPPDEVEVIDKFNPSKGTTRPFTGQSPFLFNASLNFESAPLGLDATLAFNVFGRRLSEISQGQTPDIFENPRPQLDLSLKKRITDHFGWRFNVQNILNTDLEKTMKFNGNEFVIQRYKRGITISVGLSYTL